MPFLHPYANTGLRIELQKSVVFIAQARLSRQFATIFHALNFPYGFSTSDGGYGCDDCNGTMMFGNAVEFNPARHTAYV
jgi:hypothetical protein